MMQSMFGGADSRPSGLPKNWPHSSEEDLNELPNRIVDIGSDEQTFRFRNNVVKTSKYELYDFLPKFLMEEFNYKNKIANLYFLVICILQCIPEISNTNGIPTTLIPLTFIVFIDGVFSAIEDWARHKADTLANSSKTLLLVKQTAEYEAHFQTKSWSDVKVGDIVKVRNRETVPCDIVLIDVAPTVGVSEGVCFVETKSIDGETNLKSRNTLAFNKENVLVRSKKQTLWYKTLRGKIEMEHPNSLVDSFSGVFCQHMFDSPSDQQKAVRKSLIKNSSYPNPNHSQPSGLATVLATPSSPEDLESSKKDERRSLSPMTVPAATTTTAAAAVLRHNAPPEASFRTSNSGDVSTENERYPIQLPNLLLRGCVVRNNDWVVGIAVGTGHDSKIMMTSTSNKTKLSSVEVATSHIITTIILFVLFLGLFASIGQVIWDEEFRVSQITYLHWENMDQGPEIALNWFLANFYYLLINSSIIPVSLYVSMTFARFIQSYFMMNDLEMYNHLKAYSPDETGAIIRTMTLNEELGQVSHIFSDKTGTLTSNIMEYRKMSINGVVYGMGITDIGRASWKLQDKEVPKEIEEGESIAKHNAVPHVVFYCNKYNNDLDNETIRQYSSTYDKLDLSVRNNKIIYDQVLHANRMKEFFFCLSVCHDAIREDDGTSNNEVDSVDADADDISEAISGNGVGSDGSSIERDSGSATIIKGNKWAGVKLSASNPDDTALILAAEYFGFIFSKRLPGSEILILERLKKTIEFKGVNPNSSFMNSRRARIPSPLSSSSSINRESSIHIQGGGLEMNSTQSSRSLDTGGPSQLIGELRVKHSGGSSEDDAKNDEDMYVRKVKVLQTIAFSSKRKRMSVIIDKGEAYYTLYCKGAETVIYERMSKTENEDHMIGTTDKQLQSFAHEGLRCLLVTKRQVSKEIYDKWAHKYSEACSNLNEIDKKNHGYPNIIEQLEDEMERELVLLGVTAIEDRLQEGVPQCIERLLVAGINIWVLTGDKEETAINIAIACNLIAAKDEFMRRILINKTTCPTIKDAHDLMNRELQLHDEEISKGGPVKPRSLIVDGPSLVSILHPDQAYGARKASFRVSTDSSSGFSTTSCCGGGSGLGSASPASVAPSDSMKTLFVTLAMRCKAVVGCRVSPDQKREVVTLIRKAFPDITTLGIGDGANDVAMIKEVHIGVGIKGEEGVQAVNASDYAISQFRFLLPLVLKHGRYNYIRLTRLICYVFYKNILMTICIFFFNFICGFSGQKPFSETGIQLYNLIYTSLPIILFSGYDKDLNVETVYKYPKIYEIGSKRQYFNKKVVSFCVLNAIIDSALCVVMGYFTISNSGGLDTPNVGFGGGNNISSYLSEYGGARGAVGSFWEIGAAIFTAVVMITNLKMIYFQYSWTWVHLLVNFVCTLSWFLVFYGITHFKELDYECFQLFNRVFGDPATWLYLLSIITVVTIKDFTLVYIKREFFYSPVDILQEMQEKETACSVKPNASE